MEARKVVFKLNVGPVSQQARREAKQAFKNQLQALTAKEEFIFTGDERVGIEWAIHQHVRYETDRAADVDNILKPLVDALAGPQGIMLDDNQVQAISCHWVDCFHIDVEHLRITVDDPMGLVLPKERLHVVQLEGGLCVPISGTWPPGVATRFLDVYASALKLRNEALHLGIEYDQASLAMPLQRVFHRTRLGQFAVVAESEFRAELLAQMKNSK